MRLPPASELGPFDSPIVFARVLAQAARVRRKLPRLPEAEGPRRGLLGAGTRTLRVALIGESSAAGVGAASQRTALAGGLALALAAHMGCTVDWRVHARSGYNAERVLTEIVPSIDAEPVDAIVLAIGANDAMELTSLGKWQRDLTALIGGARERLGAVPVLVARAPPFECCPTLPDLLRAFLGYRCARINAATTEILPSQHAVALSPGPTEFAQDDFASDGFHPNEGLYARLGRHLADCLVPLLGGSRSAAA